MTGWTPPLQVVDDAGDVAVLLPASKSGAGSPYVDEAAVAAELGVAPGLVSRKGGVGWGHHPTSDALERVVHRSAAMYMPVSLGTCHFFSVRFSFLTT